MRELALFAGAGGCLLGSHLLGWRTVAAVEIEDYPRAVLLQRQADGILPRFPIWDDVRTFDGRPWRGRVDVISGGFPCQDISAAGKGAGITGERSGLWSEFSRIIGEVRPRFVFVENSPLLVSRGLEVVLSDLAAMGFDAEWGVIGAHHAGAPHKRDRIWILAYAGGELIRDESGRERWEDRKDPAQPGDHGPEGALADTDEIRRDGRPREQRTGWRGESPHGGWWNIDPADISDAEDQRLLLGQRGGRDGKRPSRSGPDRRGDPPEHEGRERWPVESRMGRVAHGVAHRVDRLKAIGNGQVPAVAALAFITLYQRIMERAG